MTVDATAADGRLLAQDELVFEPGELQTDVAIELPSELRNEIARFGLEGTGDGSVGHSGR